MTERAFHASHNQLTVTEFAHFDFDSLKIGQDFQVTGIDPTNRAVVLTRKPESQTSVQVKKPAKSKGK